MLRWGSRAQHIQIRRDPPGTHAATDLLPTLIHSHVVNRCGPYPVGLDRAVNLLNCVSSSWPAPCVSAFSHSQKGYTVSEST